MKKVIKILKYTKKTVGITALAVMCYSLPIGISQHVSNSLSLRIDNQSQLELILKEERKKLGIKFMHLFDYEVKEKKPEILKFVGKPYKFLPKQYSGPTAIDIFGDYVVSFTGVEIGKLGENPIQFVVKSRRLADGYRKFFDFMWDNL